MRQKIILDDADLEAEWEKTEEGRSKIDTLEKAIDQMRAMLPKTAVRIPAEKEYLSFLVYSDSHLGSLYERVDAMRSVYECARQRGIKNVLMCGDLFDGHKMYKGQEFEQHAHGWDRQKKHGLKSVPRVKGITTWWISGNHDESLEKLAGINVGEEWDKERDDWRCVGKCAGRVVFEMPDGQSLKIDLMHPDGGTSYAISYRSQRIVEQLEGGNKPHMLLIGHFHKSECIPQYRNVLVCQVGCAQAQTPFMKRKPSAAHVGFYQFDVTINKKFNTFKSEYFAFY